MNEKYFESAEFYQKRFHNFASLWVVRFSFSIMNEPQNDDDKR